MMTDYSDDSGHAHRLDDIIRASWPAPPPVSFSGAEIERKGLMIAYEDHTRIVLARITTMPRTTVFRGSREEAVIFLAGSPDAGPPKHTDPLARWCGSRPTQPPAFGSGIEPCTPTSEHRRGTKEGTHDARAD